ncbi:SapC family protein [uncultured Ruegeria sp.]|uniref:SapC family protein n=1 Tax=uncultured Ruegeria sp. TaxID=259304 RepID=UPI0026380561|nr:SapC family protein [uncultured Ruegeria sp.]
MAQNGLTPVSLRRHGHRFWKRFTSFDFARNMADCPVVEAEILQAAATFPIIFRKSEYGYYPMAVLSMQPDPPTPFVSAQGNWLATYVPSALRCAPFRPQLIEPDGDGSDELLVDETSGLITDNPEDEVFFDKSGQLSPELKKVAAFFRALKESMRYTTHLCRVLADMGLFSPLTSYQGVEVPCGHYGVKQNTLEKIPQAHLSLLTSNGGLRLIHAHQISLTHCIWLAHAHARAHRVTDGSLTQKTTSVSGFLDALVAAQQKEEAMDRCRQEGLHAFL